MILLLPEVSQALFEQLHLALAGVFDSILLLDSFLVEPLFIVLFDLTVCLFTVLLEGLDIREDCSAVQSN